MTVPARLALAAALAAFSLPAMAQDPTPEPRVPSLTPREFEIRGDVRVALPQIERQPLSGFGPPPRTYVVPADRAALTGAYDPDLDALPQITLAEPVQPPDDLPTPRHLRAEATYGANAGRTGRFDLAAPVASGQLTADVDYDGVGWSTDRRGLAYDRLRGTAGIRTGGRFQFGLECVGSRGSVWGAGCPRVSGGSDRIPLRRLSRFGGSATLENIGSTPFEATVRYSGDRLAPASGGADVVLGASQSSALVDATARITFANRVRFDGGAGSVGLDGGFGEDAQYAAGGGALLLGRPGGIELALGARALGYRVSADNGDGDATAISPIVDLSFPAGPNLRLFASNDPMLTVRGLGDLAETNPFIADRPVVAPDVLRINARAGAELVSGYARLRGFAHLTDAPTWLVFESAPDGRFFEGYESVRIQGVTAEATVVVPSGITLDASVTVRDGEITDGGGEIPFFSPTLLRAGVQIPFSRGRMALTAYREGERPADRTDRTQAEAFSLISGDVRFDITRSLAVLLQADRLAGSVEEWPGYRLPGMTVRGGLRVTL